MDMIEMIIIIIDFLITVSFIIWLVTEIKKNKEEIEVQRYKINKLLVKTHELENKIKELEIKQKGTDKE